VPIKNEKKMKKLDILTERVGVYGKKERKYWKGKTEAEPAAFVEAAISVNDVTTVRYLAHYF
jgi:hypothetical protein